MFIRILYGYITTKGTLAGKWAVVQQLLYIFQSILKIAWKHFNHFVKYHHCIGKDTFICKIFLYKYSHLTQFNSLAPKFIIYARPLIAEV